MYLAPRVYGDLKINYSNDLVLVEEAHINDPFGQPLESVLSQNVLLQLLQLLRAARVARVATQKREREVADTELFQECEDELWDIWKSLGYIVNSRNKRRCTARYMQSAVVTMKNALHEVEGVNMVGAGRRRA
jgi:hypothetical protein